jgi:hypothetical protein
MSVDDVKFDQLTGRGMEHVARMTDDRVVKMARETNRRLANETASF